jgi:hypothetical protein
VLPCIQLLDEQISEFEKGALIVSPEAIHSRVQQSHHTEEIIKFITTTIRTVKEVSIVTEFCQNHRPVLDRLVIKKEEEPEVIDLVDDE